LTYFDSLSLFPAILVVATKFAAKLLKISRFGHKNGCYPTIFHKKSDFFRFFVVFLNTFPYICGEIRKEVIFNQLIIN